MHDAEGVGMAKRVRDLTSYLEGVLDGELLLTLQPIPERLTLDVGHDVVEEPIGLTTVVQGQDVRVG